MFQPIDRPLVRAHEETGRKALLTASHIERLTGYSKEETVALVADLIARATVPDNVYEHVWSVGDFVMWDNRSRRCTAAGPIKSTRILACCGRSV